MFCKNCGKEIDDKAEICVKCGVRVKTNWFKDWYKVSPKEEELVKKYPWLPLTIRVIGLLLLLYWFLG